METVFLIGGSGFIGKNIARYLYGKFHICVYDKFIDKDFFSGYPLIETYEMDLVTSRISPESPAPDYVLNLASLVTAERNLNLFDELISSNLKVLLNLYERFKDERQLKLFIQFGSSEEYGAEDSPFVENQRESPDSPYALIKQLTTNTTLMLCHDYAFPAMVIRPGNLFGPMQSKNKFLPYVIEQLKTGQPLNVSPCEQKRDFIYVDDFAWIIESLLTDFSDCRGQIVNAGSGESIFLKKLIEICKVEISSLSVINYGALPYRENEVMDLRCDITKLSEIIGAKIHFDIKNRIKNYIQAI